MILAQKTYRSIVQSGHINVILGVHVDAEPDESLHCLIPPAQGITVMIFP
jgi:hypothetical protein